MKKLKIFPLVLTAVFMLSLVSPAYAAEITDSYEDNVSLPTIEGGEENEKVTITVTVTTTEEGTLTEGTTADGGFTTDSGLKVEFTSTADSSLEETTESHTSWTATDGNGYTAEGGSDYTQGEADTEGISVDLITDGDVNEVNSVTTGATTTVEGTTPEDNPANYDFTETTTSGRIVTTTVNGVEVLQSETSVTENVDGSTESVTWYYYNAANEDLVWKGNYQVGDISFVTSNYPDIIQKAGVYQLIAQKVITTVDAEGNETTATELVPCLYCVDMSTYCVSGPEYRMLNIEDAVAEGYYTAEQAAHLKAIVTIGYDWGYDELGSITGDGSEPQTEPDGTIIGSTDLDRFKEKLRFELSQGHITCRDTEILEGVIRDLDRDQAAMITQMAVWIYGNRVNGNVEFSTGNEELDAIAFWLASQELDDSSETEVISSEKFIDDLQLVVGKRANNNEYNEDDDDTNDVYNASLKFSLVVTPTDKDDLIIKVVDSDGNVIKSGRVAGSTNGDETVLVTDEDGYYTFTDLELQENSDIVYSLTIEGTQFLEEGVYVFQSEDNGLTSQNLIGKYTGTTNVDVTMNVSFNFNVEEATVTTYHKWRSETTEEVPDTPDNPDVPDTPDKPDTPDNPDVPDTPDKPDTPDNPDVPDTPDKPDTPSEPETPSIPEEPTQPEVPEAPKPEEPVEDVPELDETPKTGDLSTIGVMSMLSSLAGIMFLNRKRKTDR